MLISLPNNETNDISELETARNEARRLYFAYRDLGGLKPAQKKAYELERFALQLWLEAAEIRLQAESEMQRLLTAEVDYAH